MLHTESTAAAHPVDQHGAAIPTPNAIKAGVTVLRKKGDGKVIDLNRPVTLFGSHREVKVRLKHDAVAPVHCALINTGSRLLLRDLASRVGARVNGKRTRFTELRNGDIIRIDAWKFRVKLKSCSDTCSGSSITATIFSDQPGLDIESTTGGDLWKNLPDVFLIGRRNTCEVQIDSSNASRAHALVCCLNGRPAIFDLLSVNGLQVNGKRTSMAYLTQGDVLAIGDKKLRIADVRGATATDCQESFYAFGDMTADRIKLADPARQGSSVDHVRFGGFEPRLADRDRYAGDIRKADRLGPSADARIAELDEREEKLRNREREIDEHQAALGKRELELGDREHQLRAAARKLIDTHQAKLAEVADRAREQVAGQAEALQSQQAALDELRENIERREKSLAELESGLTERHATLERRQSDLDAREATLRQDARRLGDTQEALDKRREEQQRNLHADRTALLAREAALAEEADTVRRLQAECETLREQLNTDQQALADQTEQLERRADTIAAMETRCASQSEELATRDKALNRRASELDTTGKSLSERERSLEAQHADVDTRRRELDQAFEELAKQRQELSRARAASVHEHNTVMTEEFVKLEAELAARESVVQGLVKTVEQRSAELDARKRKLDTREPLLHELSKSLDTRAGELDARQRELMETHAAYEQGIREIEQRQARLRRREDAIKTDHNAACQSADPLAISDDRSFEVLRLLDPMLGDSVRVLRRLGVHGSFDELIALAQQELATRDQKKQRGRWNPFR